MVYQWYNLTM